MTAIVSRSGAEWQELDREHNLHPFTDHKELYARRSRIISRADGVYIYDADGKKILDGMSGLWCVNAGYGRRELIDAASRQGLGDDVHLGLQAGGGDPHGVAVVVDRRRPDDGMDGVSGREGVVEAAQRHDPGAAAEHRS